MDTPEDIQRVLIWGIFDAKERGDDAAFDRMATSIARLTTASLRAGEMVLKELMQPESVSDREILTDINSEYSYSQYGDLRVIIMKRNGYVNATKLCKIGNKNFFHWKENRASSDVCNYLAGSLGINSSDMMIQITTGPNGTRGTYVHPVLITYIAVWCSIEFACKICLWMEEWKSYSKANRIVYWATLEYIEFDHVSCKEKQIQLRLKHDLNGNTEVVTPRGNIDLLTDTMIIEIKSYHNWKHAMGQILAYGKYYPDMRKVIYLFDVPTDADLSIPWDTYEEFDISLVIIK